MPELKEYIIRVQNKSDVDGLVTELQSWGVTVDHVYKRAMFGVCAKLTTLLVDWYKNDARVISIEESATFESSDRQDNAPAHLDRIDQTDLPLSGSFTFSSDGTGVTAYIIDSGAIFNHIEFEGRISPVDKIGFPGTPFDPFSSGGIDEFGHGTHVAGIIGSKTYGVTKKVVMKTAKVFNRTGFTTSGTIIAAIDAVIEDYTNAGKPASLCNMSLGAPVSSTAPETSVETAVLAMISEGITVVVAAGNNNTDVENFQPARLPEVITVGAVDDTDSRAVFSNFGNSEGSVLNPGGEFGTFDDAASNTGSAVDVFAPGTNIISTWIPEPGETDGVNTLSGTSMASPVVAGVAALVLENAPSALPALVQSDIVSFATSGKVTNIPGGTTDKLIFSIFVDHVIEWITPAGNVDFPEGQTLNVLLEAIGFTGNAVGFSLVSGTLPAGITLDGVTGLLSGVAAAVTVDTISTFTIRASDTVVFEDRTFSITIVDNPLPPIWQTSPNLGSIEEGGTVAIQLTAVSLNDAPIVYSGSLPHGWFVSTTGFVTGIAPLVVNVDFETSFTVTADDGILSTPQTFLVTITQNQDRLSPAEPRWITPEGSIGEVIDTNVFNFQLEAIDENFDPLPLKYFLTLQTADGSIFGPEGELPPGLLLDEDTGVISGTFFAETLDEVLDFTFAVFLSDGANIVAQTFTITTRLKAENLPPEWVTPQGSLGLVVAGSFATFTVAATDPDSLPDPLTYFLSSGSFPSGFSIDPVSGTISGVAELVASDEFFPFVLGVTDGEDTVVRSFSLLVEKLNSRPEWVTSEGLLLRINEGQLAVITLEATDPEDDQLTFSIVSGVLPPDLILNPNTGSISGSISDVTEDTTFSFTVRVDDSLSNSLGEELFADRDFFIEVIDGILNTNRPPEWETEPGALTQAIEGQAYFFQLEATDPDNGPQLLNYTLNAGSLPNGLALNAISGVISGFPNDPDTMDTVSIFIVRVSDGAAFALRTFSIETIDTGILNNPPEWITPAGSLGQFDESQPMFFNLQAVDPDDDDVTFSIVSGALPTGLTLDTDTGQISGTPAQVASDTIFNFDVRAEDPEGLFADRSFSLEILNVLNIPPVWVTPSGLLGEFDEEVSLNINLVAVDLDASPQPLEYNVTSGTLPPGLTLDINTGVISGTPDPVAVDTQFDFDITVNDGVAFVPQMFSIIIKDVIAFVGDTADLNVALTGELRQNWQNWNDSALIPDVDIFQLGDPDFGRRAPEPADPNDPAEFPKIFVTNKLHTADPDVIFDIFSLHHRTFKALIGPLNSASVRDINDSIIYDVIYLRVIDPQEGSAFDITTPPGQTGQFVSKNFSHLRTELSAFSNSEELPDWMTTEQILGDLESIIGYIPALEVAFVDPGKGAGIVELLNEITITIITLPSSETRFDVGEFSGNKIDVVISSSSTIIIDGVTVNLSTSDTLSDVADKINIASIPGITATVTIGTEFTGTELLEGLVLTLTYSSSSVTLSGTALIELGFVSGEIIRAILDGDATTFDKIAGVEIQINKGLGLRFLGQAITVDRYLFEDSVDNVGWIKFNPDTPNPVWTTLVGQLPDETTTFVDTNVVLIQLLAESPIAEPLVFTLLSGSLPNGLSLDLVTGVISGTVDVNVTASQNFHFSIRVKDDEENFADRGFDIVIDPP